ncbi:MAG: hypothetical protein V4646_20350 [Pseudomonadota bacterium]
MDKDLDQAGLPLPAARCLSKEQTAAYLGIGLTLLAELAIPHVRFGRRCVYDKLDIDAWLDDYKGERRRAGKENLWPVMKESIKDRIPVSGGLMQRSPTAKEYAKALGLKTKGTPKRMQQS